MTFDADNEHSTFNNLSYVFTYTIFNSYTSQIDQFSYTEDNADIHVHEVMVLGHQSENNTHTFIN